MLILDYSILFPKQQHCWLSRPKKHPDQRKLQIVSPRESEKQFTVSGLKMHFKIATLGEVQRSKMRLLFFGVPVIPGTSCSFNAQVFTTPMRTRADPAMSTVDKSRDSSRRCNPERSLGSTGGRDIREQATPGSHRVSWSQT